MKNKKLSAPRKFLMWSGILPRYTLHNELESIRRFEYLVSKYSEDDNRELDDEERNRDLQNFLDYILSVFPKPRNTTREQQVMRKLMLSPDHEDGFQEKELYDRIRWMKEARPAGAWSMDLEPFPTPLVPFCMVRYLACYAKIFHCKTSTPAFHKLYDRYYEMVVDAGDYNFYNRKENS